MKREIKFRGKNEDYCKWEYGFLADILEDTAVIIPNGTALSKSVILSTVGQFAGLYDKNGKEIYEGDIISLNGENEKIVKFIDEQAAFCLANISDLKHEKWMYIWQHPSSDWWKSYNREIIVIGNAHDNPELLKQ